MRPSKRLIVAAGLLASVATTSSVAHAQLSDETLERWLSDSREAQDELSFDSPARAEIDRINAGEVGEPRSNGFPARRRVIEARTNWPVAGTGIGMLAAGWLVAGVAGALGGVCFSITALGASGGCPPGDEWQAFRWTGWVPVVGPLIQLGLKPGSSDQDGWTAFLLLDALVQCTGLTVMLIELLNPSRRAAPRSHRVAVAPLLGPASAGLSIAGGF